MGLATCCSIMKSVDGRFLANTNLLSGAAFNSPLRSRRATEAAGAGFCSYRLYLALRNGDARARCRRALKETLGR